MGTYNTEMSRIKQPFDQHKSEAFAERMVSTLNAGALAIMTSIGHRSGLFDALSPSRPLSSRELAEQTELAERYVREWLGVMVTSGVIDYDPHTKNYRLPAEHACCLTRASSPDNLAVTAQFIGVAAAVEDQILERFKDGQGLHYHHFNRFHEVMAEDSAQLVVSALIEQILPIVPGLMNRLKQGIRVLDVGCGAGRALLRLASTYPESRFVGLDLCEDAFRQTQQQANKQGPNNLQFKQCDLTPQQSLGTFDLITAFDAIHDQADPPAVLSLIRNSLAQEGVFLMQEIGGSRYLENNIDNPFAPFLYTLSCLHCTPISLGQGGVGLGNMWGVETAQEFLHRAGFNQVAMHRLQHDPINAYFVATN